jgi:hypothetical protein
MAILKEIQDINLPNISDKRAMFNPDVLNKISLEKNKGKQDQFRCRKVSTNLGARTQKNVPNFC